MILNHFFTIFTIFRMSGFFDPVRQMSDEVEEKVAVWNADDLRERRKQKLTFQQENRHLIATSCIENSDTWWTPAVTAGELFQSVFVYL